ncbi:hypothetical protein [Desulfopila sp. IMCC35008]|uniref:hypothetical protein n=1 Tax=Desulfopila sp. IMCC35008 TaxID=2653858 RepID=UPI0013D2BCA8|nr:hypothetical protein [Desulfopila sp. IMCC35008]
MNYFTVEMMLKERREDMLRETKRLRMIREYEKSMQGRKRAFGLYVAELLIWLGEGIRERYARKMELPSNC